MTHNSDILPAASPRAVVERLHRMVMDAQLARQADLYAEDGVLEWPFAPAGVPRRVEGRERIRRVLTALEEWFHGAGTKITGFHDVVVHDTADPEVVILEFEAHGEVPATGDTYLLPYLQVFRVRDGQIVSFRDYFGGGTADYLRAPFASFTPSLADPPSA